MQDVLRHRSNGVQNTRGLIPCLLLLLTYFSVNIYKVEGRKLRSGKVELKYKVVPELHYLQRNEGA
jgi:hypothetical protein